VQLVTAIVELIGLVAARRRAALSADLFALEIS
jgi:hypothetical protein